MSEMRRARQLSFGGVGESSRQNEAISLFAEGPLAEATGGYERIKGETQAQLDAMKERRWADSEALQR